MFRLFPSLQSGCVTVGVCAWGRTWRVRVRVGGFTLKHATAVTQSQLGIQLFHQWPVNKAGFCYPKARWELEPVAQIRDSLTVTHSISPHASSSARPSLSTRGRVSPSGLKMRITKSWQVVGAYGTWQGYGAIVFSDHLHVLFLSLFIFLQCIPSILT